MWRDVVLPIRLWAWVCPLFHGHLQILLTVVAAAVLLVVLRVVRPRQDRAAQLYDLFGVGALVLALTTSYKVLTDTQSELSGPWTLLEPSLLFFAYVLAKLVIIFCVISFLLGKGFKFGGKDFQFGIPIEGRQLVEKARNVGTVSDEFFELLADLNHNVLEYLIGDFEDSVLGSDDPAETLRQQVQKKLQSAYRRSFPKVRILVVPATLAGVASLGTDLDDLVRKYFDLGVHVSTVEGDNVGIGIHAAVFGGAIIVIDARPEGVSVTAPEINAASTLYVAAANSIFRGE